MTNQEKQQLSRDVAAKYGIDDCTYIGDRIIAWLHNDSARCFELMVEHDVSLYSTKKSINASLPKQWPYPVATEDYSDHNNKPLATRIAILKALLAKEVE